MAFAKTDDKAGMNRQMDILGTRLVTEQGALARLADFAASVIGADTRYISHGEIQTGLSHDAQHWSPRLAELFAQDFAALDSTRDVLAVYDESDFPLGFAIVAWEETPRRRFAVLEDMVVTPLSRSRGIGTQLLAAAEARAKEKGVSWIFLESGLRNERAHHFFEAAGFAMLSHVFGKQIG